MNIKYASSKNTMNLERTSEKVKTNLKLLELSYHTLVKYPKTPNTKNIKFDINFQSTRNPFQISRFWKKISVQF